MIIYKELYNRGRKMPEPLWGNVVQPARDGVKQRCPTCGSFSLKWSASPDDPAEILQDTVRCIRCGHITDYYEAYQQGKNHPSTPLLDVSRIAVKG